MTDIVSPATRSRMMSGIQGKNTKPELLIRKALHKRKFRFRLHVKDLPGKPDLVFPKYNAVIQVNGCFWHGHDCHLFKWPSTRTDFWKNKIEGNKQRDIHNTALLRKLGWRVMVIRECALKGRKRLPFDILIESIERWLSGKAPFFELTGSERHM